MLLAGSVLTFFSFIGFEDMLNVSEEVKQPRRTMPWGIVIALPWRRCCTSAWR